MPYPALLHPEPLPLCQFTADPYLYRRHSNTVLSQPLWGLWALVHTRFVWALWMFLLGMGFDSKCDFAPPTILLGLQLLDVSISSHFLQHHATWKRSVLIPIPKTCNVKECSNYHTTALISHASKVMLKILQARFQQNMNRELTDVQPGFRKGRGTRQVKDHQKTREFQKNIYSALLTMPKPLIVCITVNCGKFLKLWEYQTTLPGSWQICTQVRKQQLELDMEQTGSKSGKDYDKAVYCDPVYLTYTQSTS